MALVGSTKSFYTYKNDHVKRKVNLLPNMTSNGTWMAEGTYSCRGSSTLSSVSNIYKVFNTTYTSYVAKFNENTYMDICLPEALPLLGVDISSSDGYLPAKGTIYYSDDGENYTGCGTWEDTAGTSKSASATWDTVGAHKIWRLMSNSRSTKHPSGNGDISIIAFWYYDDFDVDYSLPDGIGGWVKPFVTHISHNGLDIRKQEVFFTYKRDDLVNLWEGEDRPEITGITEAFAIHKPHNGLDIRKQESFINYRPHDGLDIRKQNIYILNRDESKVDTFKIPYGIGGYVTAYALYRVLLLAGYLWNLTDTKIKGVAIENNYIPLKAIETIDKIMLKNNTTEDLNEGEEDDE